MRRLRAVHADPIEPVLSVPDELTDEDIDWVREQTGRDVVRRSSPLPDIDD